VEKEAAMELSATIPALLNQQVAIYGSQTIFRKKDRGIWNSITWSELGAHVRDVGQGLRALGLSKGEAVAVLAESRPELSYVDLAILGCGAASVAIHPEETASRVGEIVRQTEAAIAVVEGEEQLDKVLSVRAVCPSVRRIVIIDMKGLRDFQDPGCVSLSGLVAAGTGQSDWKQAIASVAPDHVAAYLVSRDGTISQVIHAELMRDIEAIGVRLGVRPGDERLAVLPMSDATERILGLYMALKHRIISNYLENPETATENLREVKPTVFGADTEAWERLYLRISELAANSTFLQKKLYRWAISAASNGGIMGKLANIIVLPAVRSELGFTRLRIAYVGDQPVSDNVDKWARALGITVQYINSITRKEAGRR
jgi:long-chain acyl-CoA synthetase